MKISVLVVCSLIFGSVFSQDSSLIGFWDFKGGNPGEAVTSVSSSAGSQTWNGSVVKTGYAPTYSDALPAGRVYPSSSDHTPLSLQSVHFAVTNGAGVVGNGACIDIAGLSSAIAGLEEFTIEYFARFDYDQSNPYCVMVQFMSETAEPRVSCGLGNGGNRIALYGADKSIENRVANLLNHWHHFAIVYKEGKIELYVDSVSMGSATYSNKAIEATSEKSGVFRVGALFGRTDTSYAFRGNICGLRVKSVALPKSGFMHLGHGYQSATIGFWPFTDGLAGTEVESVENTIGDNVFAATASALSSNGMIPTFDADVPGKVIYGSSDFSQEHCLAQDIQSVRFFNKNGTSNTDGGKLTFADLGSMLSELGDYTLEFFFKDEDNPSNPWPWWSFICSWNAAGVHSVTVDSKKSTYQGAVAFAGCGVDGRYYPSVSFIDGKWHHFAVVHRENEKTSTVFVDYSKGSSSVASPVTNVMCTSDFVLGTSIGQTSAAGQANYAFRGKIAALRISAEALTEAEFLVATDEVIDPNTVFAWNFENGIDSHGAQMTNPTAAAYPIDDYFADWNYSVLNSSVPTYAAWRKSSNEVLWGSTYRWNTTTCVRMGGYHSVTEAEKASASGYWKYAGTFLRRKGSENVRLNQNPRSWTMEMYVKPEYRPWNDQGAGLFAKAGNGKVNQKDPGTGAMYGYTPSLSWELLWMPDGSLKLVWCEDDGSVDPESSAPGTGGISKSILFPGDWLNVGVWRHVALSYDADVRTFSLYVKGGLVGTAKVGETTAYPLWDGPFEYQFGRCMDGYAFEGYLDEVRFSRVVRESCDFVGLKKSGMMILVR